MYAVRHAPKGYHHHMASQSNISVFLGPSLTHDKARAILPADYHEPARTGDLYTVAQTQPDAIVLIDGYFDRVPTVWHKEVLWAMEQGIHVYGAASMGALRAVELAPFGMVGIGAIYEAFMDGTLEDDDEVAVAHAAAEYDFRSLSTAMVDIRATLASALDNNRLTLSEHDTLVQQMKALHYPERHYATLYDLIRDNGFSNADDLIAWLQANQVHQKQADALAVLAHVRDTFATQQDPKKVDYAFNHTTMWEGLLRYVRDGEAGAMVETGVLDELRLDLQTFHHYRRVTLLQLCATEILDEADNENGRDSTSDMSATLGRFFSQRGIPPQAINQWLAQNQTNPNDLVDIIDAYAKIDQLGHRWHHRILQTLPDILKLSGMYAPLMRRATQKQASLRANQLDAPDMQDVGVDTDGLYEWFFIEQRNMGAIPADIAQFARTSGFTDEMTFKRAVLREYCYQSITE